MLGQTIQWTVISLVLIVLVHYLYSFFIDTLTVPKVRDLINKPVERYNEILSPQTTKASQPEPNQEEMQEELRDFMSKLKKDTTTINGPAAAMTAEAHTHHIDLRNIDKAIWDILYRLKWHPRYCEPDFRKLNFPMAKRCIRRFAQTHTRFFLEGRSACYGLHI